MSDKVQKESTKKHFMEPQRRIGITGGIASGKTTIGNFLKESMNLPIIDADLYAKKILSKGSVTTKKVIQRYGQKIVTKDDNFSINRSELAQIIFRSPEEKIWLEKLTHPLIKDLIKAEIKKHSKDSIVILIIPLLFEAKFTELCNEIWVIKCDPEEQQRRLMIRDSLTLTEAQLRIKSQWNSIQREEKANIIINNNGTDGCWLKQIEELLN